MTEDEVIDEEIDVGPVGAYVAPEDRTFDDLLLVAAEEEKVSLVRSLMKQFKDGEPSAIKVVTQALLKGSISEEEKLPISDAKFKQIITFAADRIRDGRLEKFGPGDVSVGGAESEQA